MAYNFSPKIITDGLTVYMDSSNPRSYVSGSTIWYDLSKNGFTGSVLNNPIYTTTNKGTLLFDGVDESVIVSHSNLFQDNPNISLSIWFNFTALSANTYSLIDKGRQDSPTRNYYWLYYNQGGTTPTQYLRWEVGGGLGIADRVILTYNWLPNINTWYNVVATFEPNLAKLYVDGSLVASAATTVVTAAGNDSAWPLSIGSYLINLTYNFLGKLNLPMLYRKTLSANEVLQNYNATKNRFKL